MENESVGVMDKITVVDNLGLPQTDLIRGLFTSMSMWIVVKWMFVAGLLMYSLFALVIIKQVGVMADTFEDEANGVVRMFAWIHFLIAVALTVTAVVIL